MLAVMMPCSALGTGDKDTILVNDTIMTVAAENDKQISDTINKVVSAADSVSMRMLSANDSVKKKKRNATGAHGDQTPKEPCGLPS